MLTATAAAAAAAAALPGASLACSRPEALLPGGQTARGGISTPMETAPPLDVAPGELGKQFLQPLHCASDRASDA